MTRRFDDFHLDPVTLSKRLLGQRLVRIIDGGSRGRLAGLIVEVEAYLGAEDAAAHTCGGRRTRRNEAMYLPGGHAYVYMIYGVHHCLNVVCGRADEGVAVLIRALEPTEGIERMYVNRVGKRNGGGKGRSDEGAKGRCGGKPSVPSLCSGPGKLAQAMEIDRSLNGENLRHSRRLFIEEIAPEAAPEAISSSPRIGVGYAGEWARRPLRFFFGWQSPCFPQTGVGFHRILIPTTPNRV